MPESEVMRLIQIQKRKLLEREADQMVAMARRWLEVEQALEAEMLKTIASLEGETMVTEAMVLRNVRFQNLMYQARNQFAKYSDYLEETMMKAQEQNLAFGISNAMLILQAGLLEAGLGITFDKLNVNAIDMMIGYAADGSPLRELLMQSYGESVNGMLNALIEGLAKGMNPTKIARAMTDGFGVGYARALTIARTEIMRSYRMGSLEQYRNSGVVTQYKRISMKDRKVCLGCLFADGQVYDTADEFSEHPNGRCLIIPWVRGAPEPTWETGAEWFERQNTDAQKEILGQARFATWQNGTPLSAMSMHVENPTWGGKYVPTPIEKL